MGRWWQQRQTVGGGGAPASVGCGLDGTCVTEPGVCTDRLVGCGAYRFVSVLLPTRSIDGRLPVGPPDHSVPGDAVPSRVVGCGVHGLPSPCTGLTLGAVGGHRRVDVMASTTPPAADVLAAGAAATMESGKQASAEIAGAAPSKAAAATASSGVMEKVGPSSTNGPPSAAATAPKAPAAAAAPGAPAGLAGGAAATAGGAKLIPPPLGGLPPRAAATIQTDPTERRLDDAAVVQVEWYLGQVNLMNDYYLKSKMDSAYWVQLDVLLSFPKMQRLGRTDVAAFAALLRERSVSVVVDPSGTRVRPAFAAAAEAAAPSTLLLTELPSPPVSAEVITTALTAADATIPTPLSVRSEGDSWSVTWAAPNGASRAAAALEGTTICGRAVRSSIKPVELLPPPPVLPASPAGGSPAVYGNRGVPWNPGMDSGTPVYPGNIQPHMLVRPPYGYALHPQPGSPYTPTAAGSFQPSPHPSPVSDGTYVPPPPPPPAYYAQYNMYPGHPGFDLSIGASAAGAVGATSPGLPNGAMLPGMPGVDRFPGSHAGGSGMSRPGNKRGPRADGRSGNARAPTAASAPPQPGAQPNAGGATPFTPGGRAGPRAPVGTHPSAGGENRRLGPSDAAASSGSNKAASPAASSSTTSASAAPASSAGNRKVKKGGNRSNTHSGGSGGGPHSGNGNTGSSNSGSNRAVHNAGANSGGGVAGGAGGANAAGKDVKDSPAPVRRSGSGNTNGPMDTPGATRKTDSAQSAGGKSAVAAEKKPAQASVNLTATHFPPLPGLSSEEGAVPAGAASDTASSRGAFAAAARRPSSAPPPTAAAPRPSPPTPPQVKEVPTTQNPSDDDGTSRSDRSAPSVMAAAAPSSPSKSAPVSLSGAGMSYAAILRAKCPPSAPSSPKGVARPSKTGDAPSRADLSAVASSPKITASVDGSGGSSGPSASPVLSTSLSASRQKTELDGAQQPRNGSTDSVGSGASAVRASDSGSTATAAASPVESSAAAVKGGVSSTPAADAGDAATAKVDKSKAPSPASRPVSVWANKPASVLQATAAPRPPPPPPRMAPKPTPPTSSREEVAVVTKEPGMSSAQKQLSDQEDKVSKKESDRLAPARSSSGSTPEAQSSASPQTTGSEPASAASNAGTSSVAAKSTAPTSPGATPATVAKVAPNADGIQKMGAWATRSLQHALMSGNASSGDASAPAASRAEGKPADTGAPPKAAERKPDPPVVAE